MCLIIYVVTFTCIPIMLIDGVVLGSGMKIGSNTLATLKTTFPTVCSSIHIRNTYGMSSYTIYKRMLAYIYNK